MAGGTTIEWTERVWNPLRGCSVLTKECTNCYAMRLARRYSGPGQAYEGLTQATNGGPVWNGIVRPVPKDLEKPLHWRKPSRIFVNSMSDLFNERVPEVYIHRVFDVMRRAKWHQFQVLTKRAERMLELAPRLDWAPNVWAGVSIGYQGTAYKAELLAQTGAAVKWISAEPLIEAVEIPLKGIHWVVIGGESGPGSRPMREEWARDLIQQCRAAKVSVFVKQLGTRWANKSHARLPGDSRDYKGKNLENWPADLRVRGYPETNVSAVPDTDLAEKSLAEQAIVSLVPGKKSPKLVAAGRKVGPRGGRTANHEQTEQGEQRSRRGEREDVLVGPCSEYQ